MNFGYMNGHSYHLPWLNYGCKIECLQNAPYWQNLQSECQLKQRHRFYQPLFNWGWFFKDYLALEPKTLDHRTSAFSFVGTKNCEYLAYLIKASLSQFNCGKLIKGFSTLILNVVNIQGASLPKILMEGWSKGFSTSIWTVEMSIKGLLYFDLVVKNSIKGLLYFDLVVETSIKVLLYFDRVIEMSTKGLL